MGKGGGTTNTVTQAPNPVFNQAYLNLLTQAYQNNSTPLQQYQGQQVAQLSPQQQQGIGTIAGLSGQINPFIQQGEGYLNQATQNLWNETQQVAPESQAVQALGAQDPRAAQSITPESQAVQSYSPGYLQSFMSPYTQNVVNATQASFNNQNAQQAQQLTGNQVAQGAYGGDRSAIGQAALAGQQQLAQAPVIAGLENTGFTNAQQAMQAQQNVQLGMQGQNIQEQGQQQNYGLGVYGQNIQEQGQQQNLALQQQAQAMQEQQTQLGANEANAWLNSQAAFGIGNLGQEYIGTTANVANQQLGVGGLEQGLNQANLNVPYQQFLQQQAYPWQLQNELAGITEGVGSLAGGSSTGNSQQQSSPMSSILGTGLAGAGIYGAMGGGAGKGAGAGALSGLGGAWDTSAAGAAAAGTAFLGGGSAATDLTGLAAAGLIFDRGGAVRASGGGLDPIRYNGPRVPPNGGINFHQMLGVQSRDDGGGIDEEDIGGGGLAGGLPGEEDDGFDLSYGPQSNLPEAPTGPQTQDQQNTQAGLDLLGSQHGSDRSSGPSPGSLALIAAGAGMLAGRGNGAQNIGQGILQGVHTFTQLQKDAALQKRWDAADRASGQKTQMLLDNYKSLADARKAAGDRGDQALKIREQTAAATIAHQQGMLGIAAGNEGIHAGELAARRSHDAAMEGFAAEAAGKKPTIAQQAAMVKLRGQMAGSDDPGSVPIPPELGGPPVKATPPGAASSPTGKKGLPPLKDAWDSLGVPQE